MFNKEKYFHDLKQVTKKDSKVIGYLHDVLNFEPTRNPSALEFRTLISEGYIGLSEAKEFLGGL